MLCIYCKSPLDTSSTSKSDIIPDFLGDGLILDNSVCKICNNEFNTQVEQAVKDEFQFIRDGLGLKGRRGKPVRVIGKIEIKDLNKKINVDVDNIKEGIPPFKHIGPDGNEYLVVIGNNDHVEKEKAVISRKKPNVNWKNIGKNNIDLIVTILPTDVMVGPLGRRLAAKIAFERLCQKKPNSLVLDRMYDNIRNYIRYGRYSKLVSTIIFDESIMNKHVKFPFPMHSIILTHDINHNRCVGLVSIFGLYYYLVILSDYLTISAPWDDCVVIHPQNNNVFEPILRGSRGAYINIPDEAWIMDKKKVALAGKFAFKKFMYTLKYKATIIKT